MVGKVYLVGGGPGDPELLTVKAAKVLGRANIVLHDALVSREVLALVAPSAELIDVGKRAGRKLLTQEEINALLVSYAGSHEVVVRLKGGDPLVFGRAGEELAALREAGVEFEIVPGITAGIAAAAAAGISLTDRRYASQVLFTTMQRDTPNRAIQWAGISSTTTLVIYMPGPDYGHVAEQLRDAGWPLDIPCAIISHASSANQEIRSTHLADLATEAALAAPAIIVVGRVAMRTAEEISEQFGPGVTFIDPALKPVVV
ncbi:MAG: uroporphyrinogen-III C-methyltransferase [Candidatus Acidiferrales bacterium]